MRTRGFVVPICLSWFYIPFSTNEMLSSETLKSSLSLCRREENGRKASRSLKKSLCMSERSETLKKSKQRDQHGTNGT